MLKQALKLIKLFGLGPLVRRKRAHDQALPLLRGYAATRCFNTVLNVGLCDVMLQEGTVDIREFAERHSLVFDVLHPVVEYLDCIGLMRLEGDRCTLTRKGRTLLGDPRGSFELTHGYQPILARLEQLLDGRAVYKRDVDRLGDYIARGSGRLGRQLPFAVMRSMVDKHGSRRVLDLGAGNVEFLEMLCEIPGVVCRGVEIDPAAVEEGRRQLEQSPVRDRIELIEADMFDVDSAARRWPDTDAVVAIDTFHEYIWTERPRIVDLLQQLARVLPEALFYVGEFCRQPHAQLRRHPTAFVEHHLFHNLTRQKILSDTEWETLFDEAGLELVDKSIFSMVGHGYFVLRPR